MDFSMHPIKREVVIDGFNSIYYFEFGRDFSHPPERHGFWELVYVDSGKVIALVAGKARTLSQGEMIFHRPNEMHAHVSNRKDENCMLVISFTTRSAAMDFFEGKIFTADKTAKTLLKLFTEEAKRALGRIPCDYRNRDPLDFSRAQSGSFQLLECYLTEFLLTLRRRADEADSIPRSVTSRELAASSTVELILAFLEENLYASLTLRDLSAKFHLGKSQLCKLFADQLGESPMQHYHALKLAEAKRLLRSQTCSVTAVADRLGYSSVHNFSRAFKAAFGLAPTEYVKKIAP